MSYETDLITIRDFIRYAASSFQAAGLYYGHGTDNAWDEAVALVLHTLHLSHNINPAVLDAKLIQKERRQLAELIRQRIDQRLPVPYLTHEAWFAGLPFYVDERVLVPRSPIAEIIENHFRPWINQEEIHSILDLCTGSGCIAVACAKAFPEIEIDASDISPEALAVAKINLLKHHVEEQVHLIQSDLFNSLPKKQYSIVVSNPPYVSTEEMFALPPEFQHEPKLGLAAGISGLDFIVRILRQAAAWLHPQGILIIEAGNSEHALAERYPAVPFTWIDFQRGDDGVLVFTAEELKAYVNQFKD